MQTNIENSKNYSIWRKSRKGKKVGSIINHQSLGACAKGRVASPTPAPAITPCKPFPMPSNSQQEASTCPTHEFCGRPLGLLHPVLSLSKTTQEAGSSSGQRATCSYSQIQNRNNTHTHSHSHTHTLTHAFQLPNIQ